MFLKAFLAGFRPEETFGTTATAICSSPRLDGYSGGAVVITRDGYHIEDTSGWLDCRRFRSCPASTSNNEADADDFTDRARAALTALVRTVEATGGCIRCAGGETRPLGDEGWVDLGEAYLAACTVLGQAPVTCGGTIEDEYAETWTCEPGGEIRLTDAMSMWIRDVIKLWHIRGGRVLDPMYTNDPDEQRRCREELRAAEETLVPLDLRGQLPTFGGAPWLRDGEVEDITAWARLHTVKFEPSEYAQGLRTRILGDLGQYTQ